MQTQRKGRYCTSQQDQTKPKQHRKESVSFHYCGKKILLTSETDSERAMQCSFPYPHVPPMVESASKTNFGFNIEANSTGSREKLYLCVYIRLGKVKLFLKSVKQDLNYLPNAIFRAFIHVLAKLFLSSHISSNYPQGSRQRFLSFCLLLSHIYSNTNIFPHHYLCYEITFNYILHF